MPRRTKTGVGVRLSWNSAIDGQQQLLRARLGVISHYTFFCPRPGVLVVLSMEHHSNSLGRSHLLFLSAHVFL